MIYAGKAVEIRERYADRNLPIPENLFPTPIIEGYEEYFEAFWNLNPDRAIGMGSMGEVPFAAISEYAHRSNIDDADEFWFFHDLIRAMDRAYIKQVLKDD